MHFYSNQIACMLFKLHRLTPETLLHSPSCNAISRYKSDCLGSVTGFVLSYWVPGRNYKCIYGGTTNKVDAFRTSSCEIVGDLH